MINFRVTNCVSMEMVVNSDEVSDVLAAKLQNMKQRIDLAEY